MMSTTQIIPSTELTGIETAIAELTVQTQMLPELRKQASDLTVTDEDTYTRAGLLRQQVRVVGAQGKNKLQPYLDKLKNASDFFRTLLNQHKNQAEQIDGILAQKMSDYYAQKERARVAEERAQNEAREKRAKEEADAKRQQVEAEAERVRKANEAAIKQAVKSGEVSKTEAKQLQKDSQKQIESMKQQGEAIAQGLEAVAPVTVKSEVPTIPGFVKRTQWTFKITDIDLIPREFLLPNRQKDGTFAPEDFPQIGKMVRDTKSKASAEAQCPGIVVTDTPKV
jgi:uncharacterized membrane protein YqiK